ncbi:hypothetical protein GCM10025783_02550 [Amnibacterium soli]|uniref:Uncharacterized protein n=1 Tax=Amnibacterium soli TaxID=1282736 RepID=A0ABP8YR95_9MICO
MLPGGGGAAGAGAAGALARVLLRHRGARRALRRALGGGLLRSGRARVLGDAGAAEPLQRLTKGASAGVRRLAVPRRFLVPAQREPLSRSPGGGPTGRS